MWMENDNSSGIVPLSIHNKLKEVNWCIQMELIAYKDDWDEYLN